MNSIQKAELRFFVATPNYNYGRFIGDAIKSVQAQNHPVKHFIQDGLSSDDTIAQIESHCWDGLEYASEADGGQCDAVNRALTHADNEVDVVSWLNSDEYYLPGAFQSVAKFFNANPEIDIVYGNSIHVDEQRRLLRLLAQHRFSPFVLRTYGTYIQSSSIFFRSRVLRKGDLYLDPDFKQVMDLELYVRLWKSGYKFGFINHPLSAFRVHQEQLTNLHGKEVSDSERRRVSGVATSTYVREIGRARHAWLKMVNGNKLSEFAVNRQLASVLES
ncbi:glycosyltransferase [Rhodococcus pyridinivorans]